MDYTKLAHQSINISQSKKILQTRSDAVYDSVFFSIMAALTGYYIELYNVLMKNFPEFCLHVVFSTSPRFESVKSTMELLEKYYGLRELYNRNPSPTRLEKVEKYRKYCLKRVDVLMRRSVSHL